ncbi:hypothetical protein DFH11DRAFT_1620404 [Phellopilus nigrolimitatus]|nr:hypothetical protein DFH11DRAFT_1620404 [Phellopilus nigrolimitatus]
MWNVTIPVLFVLALLVLRTLWRSSSSVVRQFFIKKSTVLHDLPNTGKPRTDGKRIAGTAVVCGGRCVSLTALYHTLISHLVYFVQRSFAGLFTARILADHFEDVLVVEPEAWLDTPEGRENVYDENGVKLESRQVHTRSRVFQYKTTHALQPLTYKVLKHLFPNIDEEVRKTDGRIGVADFNIHLAGGRIIRNPTDDYPDGDCPRDFFFSREAFERLLRRLVIESSPRIRWMVGTAANVRTVKDDQMTLSSVVVRMSDHTEKTIPAAMVIDCTGGSQGGLKWLRRVGAEADKAPGSLLPLDRLRVSYSTAQQTRTYQFFVPPEARARLPIPNGYDNSTWIYSFMPKFGIGRKSFLVDRIEGHRIRIMFGSRGDQHLPMEFSEIKDFFDDFSADERVPDWFMDMLDILLEYEDLAEASTTKYPTLSSVRYERAAYLPHNFVAVGDSVMQVNPTFGQGVSKACAGAIVLDSMLRSRSMANSQKVIPGFGREFFKKLADKTASAWQGTKPIDYLFESTIPAKGEKLSDERLSGGIVSAVMQLARNDLKVDSTLFHVICFLAPPTDLMHPSILVKVILLLARQRLGYAV